jgi:thiosulfate dehydrogenase (quinone) large subunit
MKYNAYLLVIRFLLSFIMVWSFADKLLGLGFSTIKENAWINGGSPTEGFLSFAVRGPLEPLFNAIAGNPIVDWLFMMGLLLIGLAFLFGAGMKIAGYAGALMMILIYFSQFPPANNPIVDQHIVYAVLFIMIGNIQPSFRGDYVRKWWISKPFVGEWLR